MGTTYNASTWRMPENNNISKASNYSRRFANATYNQFLNCGNGSEFSFGNGTTDTSFSFSLLVKFTGSGTTWKTTQALFSKTSNYQTNAEYDFYFTGGSLYFTLSNFDRSPSNNNKYASWNYNWTDAAPDVWYSIIITYDMSVSNVVDRVKFIIDGDNKTISGSNVNYVAMGNRGENFLISRLSNTGPSSYDLNGYLSDFAVFDYAVDSATIWNNGTPINLMALSNPPICYLPIGDKDTIGNGTFDYNVPNISVGADSVFDFATNGYIELPTVPELQMAGASNYTTNIWFNRDSTIQEGIVGYNYSNSRGSGWYLWCNGTTFIAQLGFDGGSSNFGSWNYTVPSADFIGSWHMITMVFDGSQTGQDRLKVYYDGEEPSGATYSNPSSFPSVLPNGISTDNTRNVYLGVLQTGTNPAAGLGPTYLFNGQMSNAEFWKDSLTSAEVLTLYNYGSPLSSTQPQADDLTAWYKMGVDTSNWNGSNWQLSNSTANYSSALDFEGSDRINVDSVSSVFSDASNFTISGWFNWANYSNANEWLFMAAADDSSPGINTRRVQLETYNKQLYFSFMVDSAGAGLARINMTTAQWDAKWVHMVAVFDANAVVADRMIVYFNGVRQVAAYSAPTGNAQNNINNVFIGNRTDGLYNFGGLISNFAIYNTSLSSSNVLSLYNSGTPQNTILGSPQAWWKLDSTTITDSSSNGNTGTNVGATQVSSLVSTLNGISEGLNTTSLVQSNLTKKIPYSSYSISFLGTTGYFTSTPSIGITSAITVSAWVKIPPTNTGNTAPQVIICEDNTGGAERNWILYYRNQGGTDNKYIFAVFHTDGSATNIISSGITPNNGLWQNVVATFDGTTNANGIKLYVNGQQAATPVTAGSTGVRSTSGVGPSIGALEHGPWPIDAEISNCAVWESSITDNDAINIYNNGTTQNLNNFRLTPYAWWPLNEDSVYFNGSVIVARDLINAKDVTGVNLIQSSIKGSAPGSTGNGLSSGSTDFNLLEEDSLNSINNSYSINMADYADGITNPANSGQSTNVP